MSDSMVTKKAVERWGYSPATISRWRRQGSIKGTDHDGEGSPWHIPKDAECPKTLKNNEEGQNNGKM